MALIIPCINIYAVPLQATVKTHPSHSDSLETVGRAWGSECKFVIIHQLQIHLSFFFFHQHVEMLCLFDGYQNLFISCQTFPQIFVYICVHLCVSQCFVSLSEWWPLLESSLHTLGIKRANIYLSKKLTSTGVQKMWEIVSVREKASALFTISRHWCCHIITLHWKCCIYTTSFHVCQKLTSVFFSSLLA